MASIKDLKKRIGTVKNTQQTTKAMKMVSAAKLRRAQEAIVAQRPYARQIERILGSLAESIENVESPFIRNSSESTGTKKLLLVVVSSDRGLCGGFNGNIVKLTQRWMGENASQYSQIDLGYVGKKALDVLKRRISQKDQYKFLLPAGKVTFGAAKGLSDQLVKMFENGEYQEIKFVYNEFKNAVSQKVVLENFLPIQSSKSGSPSKGESVVSGGARIIKPTPAEVFDLLLKKNFGAQVYRVLLESQASEHGARMSAMENATKNAGEMMKKLSLQYNKQRQAGITKELLEIISGSESQKS